MVDTNRVCIECTTEKAELACRCVYPPAFLCYNCVGQHIKKSPNACHSSSEITSADLEENKDPKNSFKETKMLYQTHLQSYKTFLLRRKAKFVEERIESIKNIFDQMRDHILAEDNKATLKLDQFV